MFDPGRMAAYGGAGVHELIDAMRDCSGDVVLSSEEFIHAIHYAPDAFQHFLDLIGPIFPNVVIVVYLRSQADYLQSAYFERVKAGMSADFSSYVSARLTNNLGEFPLDYELLVDELLALKGAEIVIRDYNSGSAVEDFFQLCGIEIGSITQLERKNERSGFKRCLTQFYENIHRRRANASELGVIEEVAGRYKDNPPQLSSLCKRGIVSRFAQGNRRVSAAYRLEGLDCESSDVGYSTNRCFSNEPSLLDPFESDRRRPSIDHIFSYSFAALISTASAATPSWTHGLRWAGVRR
ncbi:hypothetical protein Ms3S1_35560 [Methylosinus sp. 3S-1]